MATKPLTPEYNPRDLLSATVSRLMQETPALGSPAKLAAKCFYPDGSKRAGRKVSERFIRYVINPPATGQSPSLEVITAIATAFKKQAWELLVDDRTLYLYMLGKTFSTREATSDERVIGAFGVAPPVPPDEAERTSASRHRKKTDEDDDRE